MTYPYWEQSHNFLIQYIIYSRCGAFTTFYGVFLLKLKIGVNGSVWGCMGVYGEAAAAATHNVASLCGNALILFHTFPYYPIKKAAINHIARVCGEKKAAAKNAAAFELSTALLVATQRKGC